MPWIPMKMYRELVVSVNSGITCQDHALTINQLFDECVGFTLVFKTKEAAMAYCGDENIEIVEIKYAQRSE